MGLNSLPFKGKGCASEDLSVESCVDWEFWFIDKNISLYFRLSMKYLLTILEEILIYWQEYISLAPLLSMKYFCVKFQRRNGYFGAVFRFIAWILNLVFPFVAPVSRTFVTQKLTTWPLYGNCFGWILYNVSILMDVHLCICLPRMEIFQSKFTAANVGIL